MLEDKISKNMALKESTSRAVSLLKSGNYRESIETFNQALELDRSLSDLYNCPGIANKKLGKSQEAIGDYSRAIELHYKNASAYYNRGNAYIALGNHMQAIEDFSKAITFTPILKCY